ncbi:hypothetical protein DAEQUDRAFT_756077 [Daedalea quercina L-15889]|uniref:Uncharacterized protein n=1 Tax=Daedalea quercina L-15889 TaxID=1314783 RepID=A0A165RQI3_9APHY|nr:hypothetical protein DAEQUDRAFT_756077 [Daedalea quercina L-15889]
MSTEPTKFPSPIGGVPNPHDLAPSIIFVVAYAITIPLVVYRLASKNSRNLFIIATAAFSVERVMDFTFRALEAEKSSLRTTAFWVNWLQGAYAAGFVSIAGDVSNIARIFLLKSTRGSDPATSSEPPAGQLFPSGADEVRGQGRERSADEERALPKPFDSEAALNGGMLGQISVGEVLEDEPRRRAWIERLGILALVLRLTAIALAAVYSGLYFNGTKNHSNAVLAQQMRYASDIIVVVFLQLIKTAIIWAMFTRPRRVARRPALFLIVICLLLSVPALYRLAAMSNYTDSLLSMAPGSLNGPDAKAVFYVLHILPEWIAGTLLLTVNVKQMYGFTGMRG